MTRFRHVRVALGMWLGACVGVPEAAADAPEAWLEEIERRAFAYFIEQRDPASGLIRNTTEAHAPASSTALGAALSALPIAVERGWISRDEGLTRARQLLTAVRSTLEHEHGFLYHFLDPRTGRRTWQSEVSCMDTAIALAGALAAGAYFKGTDVERLAREAYERADWTWFLGEEGSLWWGWKPETGFEGGAMQFSEGILAYLLALGSPMHPIPAASWEAMRRPLARYAGHPIVYTQDGSLFAYLLPLAWIDLRHRHDAHLDYWTNARLAVLANRQFCEDEQARFATYRAGYWGLSAALGPDRYVAYGAKPGQNVHDGTVAPYAVAAAIPVAPELALPTYQRMRSRLEPRLWGRYGFTDAFNLDRDYFSPDYIALDQGLTLLAIENYRTGLIWRLLGSQPAIQQGLARAGFVEGAVDEPLLGLLARRGNPGARADIPMVAGPLMVDGKLGDWAPQEPFELTPAQYRSVEFGLVRSEQDASAAVLIGWTAERLYLAGLVFDDETVSRHRGREIYQDDCLELFFDLDQDGFRFDGDPRDAQIGLAPSGGPDGAPQVWVWGALNRHAPEIQVALERWPGGYAFELGIPWPVVGWVPHAGQTLGFGLALHDRDADGQAAKLHWSLDRDTLSGELLFGEVVLSGSLLTE